MLDYAENPSHPLPSTIHSNTIVLESWDAKVCLGIKGGVEMIGDTPLGDEKQLCDSPWIWAIGEVELIEQKVESKESR